MPSPRLSSRSCLSLKGHLSRTADASPKDWEAVLPSGCCTLESDGFFLGDSLLAALNYTENAEEEGDGGAKKFVWENKMGTPTPSVYFAQGFNLLKQGAADPLSVGTAAAVPRLSHAAGRCQGCVGHHDTATAEGEALPASLLHPQTGLGAKGR